MTASPAVASVDLRVKARQAISRRQYVAKGLVMVDLYILRHGETEWNRAGRMQGWLDSPLTEKGRAQAERQGELLAAAGVGRHHRFWSSPQGRAWDTAGLALSRFGAPILRDDRLREIGIGDWSGLTRAEIARHSGTAFDGPDDFFWMDAAPRGEGFDAVRARARSFLDDLDGPAVIVTHGILSRFLRAAVLDLDLEGTAGLPGGQGVVYRLADGIMTKLV